MQIVFEELFLQGEERILNLVAAFLIDDVLRAAYLDHPHAWKWKMVVAKSFHHVVNGTESNKQNLAHCLLTNICKTLEYMWSKTSPIIPQNRFVWESPRHVLDVLNGTKKIPPHHPWHSHLEDFVKYSLAIWFFFFLME